VKRTLLIAGNYPLPETTGENIRTMNFVRFFKERGSVDIACSQTLDGKEPGNPIFSNEYFLKKRDYPQHFTGRLAEILQGRPYPLREYSDDSINLLSSIIEANDYDYIVIRYIVNAYYFYKLPVRQKPRIILDFDDLYSGNLYEILFNDKKSLYKKIKRNVNRKFLLRYEKKCLDLGLSIFCSDEDRRRTAGNRKYAFVVPNIYLNRTFDNYDFGNGFENRNTLLFVGTLTYSPNIEGLKWFINLVWPEFKRKFPDAKFIVVGHIGNSSGTEIKKCCQAGEDIELHTNVPDVKEYYKRCGALVVPLFQGGGTRIKILEAALASRPVLSTPVGAEGLDLLDGRDILLFKNTEEFSVKFKQILEEKRYNSLVRSAKEYVLKNYSLQKFDEAMKKVLDKNLD